MISLPQINPLRGKGALSDVVRGST
jgi:hypothetical protein